MPINVWQEPVNAKSRLLIDLIWPVARSMLSKWGCENGTRNSYSRRECIMMHYTQILCDCKTHRYASSTICPLQVHSINFQGRGLLQLIDKALRCNQCFCLLMGHEIRWKASVTSASILRVLGNVTTLLEHCRVTGPTPPVLQVHVAKTAGS